MKAIIPELKKKDSNPIYIQLYEYIKEGIKDGEFGAGEKLPSIRALAAELRISVTTVNLAYQQLLVEGYIYSRPQSGYYISQIKAPRMSEAEKPFSPPELLPEDAESFDEAMSKDESELLYDEDTFDFVKWKKALTKILNEHSNLLLSEGNPQGEYSLRREISRYLFQNRGIISESRNIVIGAGMQQLTGQLSRLMLFDGILDLVIEKPGYAPVNKIFHDYGIKLHPAKVEKDGISLSYILKDRRCAIYTSPSNQFPTGAVMPAGKRYDLLQLASEKGSYIIEDDYDSELRYFGQPIPPLKSLDRNDSVIYLSSFSSTLFPAVKISYMILPERLSYIFAGLKDQYTQSCSKTEQLALAYFIESGNYHLNVRKLRRMYAQKLNTTIEAFEKYAKENVTLIHSSSGINMLIEVKSSKSPGELCRIAHRLGISSEPVLDEDDTGHNPRLILYFSKIPSQKIESSIKNLLEFWV